MSEILAQATLNTFPFHQHLTPGPIYAPAFLLVELQIRGAGTRAQAYWTNIITSIANPITTPFITQSHFGNVLRASFQSNQSTIFFIYPFPPLWLAKLNTRGFHHHEPVLVCQLLSRTYLMTYN